MPEDMILEIVDAFGQAAAKLKEAGFEMLTHSRRAWLAAAPVHFPSG